MGNFFKRKPPKSSDERVEPENRADQRLDRYYSAHVPASARTPDMQRRAVPPLLDDDDDEDSEELTLLRTLAEEVARDKRPPARRTPATERAAPAPIARFTLPDADAEKLNVFRDTQAAVERPSITQSLAVQDVDIAELLDTLETTAAALRRRKAA